MKERRLCVHFCLSLFPGSHRLFHSSFDLYISAEFAENKGLSGARRKKRSAEDEAEDDGESLGSEDTYGTSSEEELFGTMSSSKKAGKPPTPAKQPPGSPAPVKAAKEKMTDLEMLAHRMDKMTVNAETWGYNFNCPHPHYWWTFTIAGITYFKAEFLTWTVHHQEITCKISDDGKLLYVGTKLPDRFINIFRQRGYYADQAAVPEEGDVMLEQGRKCVQAIHEAHSMEQIKPLTVVKLPFAVQEDFHDPYRPMDKGYGLRTYPHEHARQPDVPAANMGDPPTHGPPQSFFVIHVCMQSKTRAKMKTSMEYTHINMTANEFGEV